MWQGVIDQHGNALNGNGMFLLQLCLTTQYVHNEDYLPIQKSSQHKYTWYGDSLGQRSFIEFCIVSTDLFKSVFEVRVNRGTELSTDHHLAVCKLPLEKQAGLTRTCGSRRSDRIKWETLEDKDVHIEAFLTFFLLFPELPECKADVEEEWRLFKVDAASLAARACVQKDSVWLQDGKQVIPWWNEGVKNSIRVKQIAYNAWLQNKVELFLHSRCAEAQKYATQAAKSPKCSLVCLYDSD